MSQVLSLILLALAVSIDNFSVGFTYGLRKMKIPFKSIFIIACCSGFTLLLSMLLGHVIAQVFSSDFAEQIGGGILIILGIWILYQFFRPDKEREIITTEKNLVNFEIKSLGIVINILRKPMSADFDNSGTITGVEAIVLGFALSLDAFGAGIGASMLGFSPFFLTLAVIIMSTSFVSLGMFGGRMLSKKSYMEKFSFIPGIILIIIGIFKL
ncbi:MULTISPECIES: sporulation membrane protein YtaF [Bacillaceae]|uniref:sporulation membrane protein YtaF n=1 Tax=Bacillaceae TaxID=186817 RepID=UPI001E311151|nr:MULTISPECIES: sporulation membrane protein YtaF [Bacillaceae]MCE4051204.1 sporulation membrane protein YtaF [Bacillus sp. Au-Bac7]MCM3029881.1 sporulation membrane protein YtaF [Niallia sp. MER 6]MDL0436652.1 sporulation membrane protein YtaF [Niallia sp. SS-2023]UPO86826.1 sporulation membrane protein YtaF [Niallia sp. Man26]